MNILVAPDSFKGSLTAERFCRLAKQVIEAELVASKVSIMPMADGGEGTVAALVAGTGGRLEPVQVTDPLGRGVVANIGILGGDEGTAVVEMAAASGLPLVPAESRNPLKTTSFGTGELVLRALDLGARRIILGLGGSATNDGGVGALQALGYRFLDSRGCDLTPGGEALLNLSRIDVERVDPRLAGVRLDLATDVVNPLLGPSGATMVYGRQKGADSAMQDILERGLARLADAVADVTGRDQRQVAGTGAAGGMGFGFHTLCRARIASGFEVVADAYGLKEQLEGGNYDLLITGEGEVNGQSGQGKLVGRLAKMAAGYGLPVLVVAGSLGDDAEVLYGLGVTAMFPIVPGPVSLVEAMGRAEQYLVRSLTDICRYTRQMCPSA